MVGLSAVDLRMAIIKINNAMFFVFQKFCYFHTVHVNGSDVYQTPTLWEKEGQSATIHCNHTKGPEYYQMYWYRQLPGEDMDLIVFTQTAKKDHDFGSHSKDKFSATKLITEPESGTFTVKNLRSKDKGLYFCSVSQHNDADLTDGRDVYQTPMLWEKEGQNATTHCNHTWGAGYYQMYWYRQLPGKNMELIVYTTTVAGGNDFGSHSKDKFSATKTKAESGTFTVKNLEPEDQGLYFCAVSEHVMIPAALIRLSAALLCVGGVAYGSDVTQTGLLWTYEGQSATIDCSHTKGATYDEMYWYQQLPGEGMKQIVFTTAYSDHQYESGFDKDKFTAEKKNAQTGSLTVKNLQPEDSGVYFCSVKEHSDAGDLRSSTKTLLLLSLRTESELVTCLNVSHYRDEEEDKDIMSRNLSRITILLFCFFCLSRSNNVHQEPPSILGSPQDSVQISCSHSISYYNTILWYQKPMKESALKLIGYIQYSNPVYEIDLKQSFNMTGDGSKKAELHVLKLQKGESCIYYCAANKFSVTKTEVERGTFTVKNLEPEDKGLYFCAVRKHSDTKTLMIPAALIRLSAALLCVGGLAYGSDVTQTGLLWTYEGQSATINCSHTKGATYDQMYWYQQLPGEGMKQIVYTTAYSDHQYESGFDKDKFPAEKKNAQTGSLTVKNLEPEDSGVYFCSVREHSDAGDLRSSTKTQLLLSFSEQQCTSGASLILGSPQDSVKISCSHSISSYDTILWYQKPMKESALKLIGYIRYSTPVYENDFKQGFNMTGDGSKKAELHVLKLQKGESCIYYCAATYGSDVTQTGLLWTYEGQSATINCSHTKGATYDEMYWYQQLPGEGMKQIVFTTAYSDHQYESGFDKDKFTAEKKNAQTGSLTVKNLQPEDSGVYFCSVKEHSDAGDLRSSTKTLLLLSLRTECLSLSNNVHQEPPSILGSPQDSVQISCSHSISYYNTILWYQKPMKERGGFEEYFPPSGSQCVMTESPVNRIIMKVLITFILSPLWIQVHCQDVAQYPEVLWSYASTSAAMNCSHNKDVSHTQMYWYRQRPGEAMTLAVYTALGGQPDYGESSQSKYSAVKDNIESGALTVKDLEPGDGGGLEVRQSPSELITKHDENIQISCSHEKTNYWVMLWYQRSPRDTAMKLIGNLYFKNVEMEEPYKEYFNISGDLSGNTAKNSSLLIKPAAKEPSAVYYCAARETRRLKSCRNFTKTAPKSFIISFGGTGVEESDGGFTAGDQEAHGVGGRPAGIFRGVTRVMIWWRQPEVQGSAEGSQSSFTGHLGRRRTRNYSESSLGIIHRETHDDLVYHNNSGESGQVSAVTFQQSASQIVRDKAQVRITCSHDDSNLPVMLWYQQSKETRSVVLIGYTYRNNPPTYEGQFKDQFELSPEGPTAGALTVRSANASHSAVYLCAASP
ncbi:unnamed protein product, partial [Menidia menidia]